MLKILGCGRNVGKYIYRYIHSLELQTFNDFEALLILDDPTDDTIEKTMDAAKKSKRHITIQINTLRKHQPRNFYEGVRRICFNDNDICCIVDLDDYLLPHALQSVYNRYHTSPNCLLTYGTFQRESRTDLEFQRAIPKNYSFRKQPWITSHLKTFKYKLFKCIDECDFKDHTGEWFKRTGDQVIMYPMLEMAGITRAKQIKEVIYILNGDIKSYPSETELFKVHEIVRKRNPYKKRKFD